MCLGWRLIWLAILCWPHACIVFTGWVSARQPTYFLLPESRQEPAATAPDPFAALRGDLRRPALAAWGGKTRCAFCESSAQTDCRQPDDETSALCGAEACSKSRASQAQTNMGEITNNRKPK